MAKRGRKPGKKTEKKYWGEQEEQAVIRYNNTNSASEKDEIYNTILKPAFKTMVESIIRRYHLYGPEEEYQQTFDDTLSFMLTKMNCYNPERGTKAYSYCGTIAKNYLIQKITQFQKKIQRTTPYEEVTETIENNIRYSNEEDAFAQTAEDLIKEMAYQVEFVLESGDTEILTPNEIKVGTALCELLNHWNEILNLDDCSDKENSNKLNKSSVLYFLREETRLDTKEVRDGMKRFKDLYRATKHKFLN